MSHLDDKQLLRRLRSVEGSDLEFKAAARDVPNNAFKAVSAFANSGGGYIVFGVSEGGDPPVVTGVADADKIQRDFLNQVRDERKVSVDPGMTARIHELPEGRVISFHVPEASRQQKPVYLDGDPNRTFVRRGAANYQCNRKEMMRFVRDAGIEDYDSEPLGIDPSKFYDEKTLRWYRSRFEATNDGKDGSLEDIEFLRKWGHLVNTDGKLAPTRAAVLVLGDLAYVRQHLPRMVVDIQFYNHTKAEYSSATRWADRLVVEENLVDAWRGIRDFFMRHGDRPFKLDPDTMERIDQPPEYIAFREAAINLLIHQDFGNTGLSPSIQIFRDRMEFYNPGDAFADRDELIVPGAKELRNPNVVDAFRRIGLSEHGGTGFQTIFDSWRGLGFLPPEIENDKAGKTFKLTLPRERMFDAEFQSARAKLSINLSKEEEAIIYFLFRQGEADIFHAKSLTGLPGADAVELVENLTNKGLVQQIPGPGIGFRFVLSDYLQGFLSRRSSVSIDKNHEDYQATEQATAQAAAQASAQAAAQASAQDDFHQKLSETQWAIIEHTDTPRSITELMEIAGFSQRRHLKEKYMVQLITEGILQMTVPDKPSSPNQQYVLTDAGAELRAVYLKSEAEKKAQKKE